ncbi:unnamed protein product [Sphenostylis stenocarpa]|uniref:Uncharacterized protein n=1 Tax=Sphenostylis stenocarpa TaxID=92480 RepID=A0AA86T2D5_9FABA|nr:unnamed protein product [Sphenostylis stenocarpa]
MEAVGSRLSRASSRYGTATVFTGPVRKWKKKWVHVTPSSSPSNTNTITANNAHSPANSNASSRLLLRRWTPTTADDAAATVSDEPPRRKFRYTPFLCCVDEVWRLGVFGIFRWNEKRWVGLLVCMLHELGFGVLRKMIAVLDEQKKMMVVKEEHESATESDQSAARQKNVTHEMQGKLNMNEKLEETKDSNIVELDHGLDLHSNKDETSQNSDTQLEISHDLVYSAASSIGMITD